MLARCDAPRPAAASWSIRSTAAMPCISMEPNEIGSRGKPGRTRRGGSAGPRIELEPIGPRERLQPGESASFIEYWWLLSHPFPKKGDQIDLKALHQQVLKQTIGTN